jgi:hypothetical protein
MSSPNNQAEEVASEAISNLREDDVNELTVRAEHGDKVAIDTLINHFGLTEGDNSDRLLFWTLYSARMGDCKHWRELMFITLEDGGTIPTHLFASGETLEAIGERHGCGPYVRLRPQRAQDAQGREAEVGPSQN